ncbi:hypothetical protein PO124_16060 [Bacillus licheniformis]|nr:hypothetical protein [Bacillus licheniformis]
MRKDALKMSPALMYSFKRSTSAKTGISHMLIESLQSWGPCAVLAEETALSAFPV